MEGKNGNTTKEVNGTWADFVGRVCQALWSAFKPAVACGKFDFAKFKTIDSVRSALRRGFLIEESSCVTDLGLSIGKVTKEQLAELSKWDLKNLYELFFQQVFDIHVSFPDELMPDAPDNYWPICDVAGISNEALYQAACRLDMPKWKWTEGMLDAGMKLDRGRDADTRGSRVVCTPPDFEAGEKLKNISGNDIDKRGDDVLMFRERWILGLFIFWLTGLHLDKNVVTATGSRNSGGFVMCVYFSGGGVDVYCYGPDRADDDLRFRVAVSR
ncbi:MAG TPA: hypothetical protein VF817_01440 [Patescibacteria group bacterium]